MYSWADKFSRVQNFIKAGDKILNVITVVDARMGRGKSSAAIRYMNEHKGEKRFLYITPYLNEVDRICEQCDFDQSDGDNTSKSAELKYHMGRGKNIAATHSLFYNMDDEALELVKKMNYSLIIDESIKVVERLNVSENDFDLIMGHLVQEDDSGYLQWIDDKYSGRFIDYKNMADTGTLLRLDSALLNIMNPEMLKAFDEVFMLTYLFDGQYQKAYLELFGFEYRIIGVIHDEHGFRFSDAPDAPPPIDYRHLIQIIDNPKTDKLCSDKYALSKNWFKRRGYDHKDMRILRNAMRNFFQSSSDSDASKRLWTTYKDYKNKLVDARTGRFRNSFLQVSSRATNEYRDRTDIAYIANRFIDPNLQKFFSREGITINEDQFALAEMLQWIWRSAIRDDKPIRLYVPSRRMRELLEKWIEDMSKGENIDE